VSNEVYANNMEVSCKQAAGKTICSFPDVCFTPPQTPATPPGVPIPYPNTGMASDATDGSSTVMISGQEVMLKDKSSFKKSSGDEAGCAPQKGLINATNTGKVIFAAWSMDVKVEGENVVRHLDMTTGNNACPNPNAAIPWPHADAAEMEEGGACHGDAQQEKEACEDYEPYKSPGKDVCAEAGVGSDFTRAKGATTTRTKKASADKCSSARRCRLVSFDAKPNDGINGCCPAQTGDHLVPKSSFFKESVDHGEFMDGWEKYKINDAPTMCLEGGSNSGSHGLRHAHHKSTTDFPPKKSRPFNDEVDHCVKGAKAVAPDCSEECIKHQLKKGHQGMGDQRKKVKYSPTGGNYRGKELLKKLFAKIESMLPEMSGV
jgi:hypothetical protein